LLWGVTKGLVQTASITYLLDLAGQLRGTIIWKGKKGKLEHVDEFFHGILRAR
jgi:hypothetical protein